MARQQWWKTCTLSSFLGFSLSLWLARWFRAPHFDRYFGACPGKSSTKSQKVWKVKQPKGRHSNFEYTECVVASREERKMSSFKGLRDWCSDDDCDGRVFHVHRVQDQGWVAQCSTGEVHLHARKHIGSSSTQTAWGQQDMVTGRGWGRWGEPAAPACHALALLWSSRLVVPAKDCQEICFSVSAGLEKADNALLLIFCQAPPLT